MILASPTYITCCDSAAVLQLTQQLSASKTRTRHRPLRAAWLYYLAKHENVSMQFVPTDHQKADILTKGLTAYMHELARQGLRLQTRDGLCACATASSRTRLGSSLLLHRITSLRPFEHVASSEGLRIVFKHCVQRLT